MKKQGKRLISVLLSLAMVVTMIPMFGVTASAANWTEMTVSNSTELKNALQANGDVKITLAADIKAREDLIVGKDSELWTMFADNNPLHRKVTEWCTLGTGQKRLNLAGHSIDISDNIGYVSFLFCIPAGAEMIVWDSAPNKSFIAYDGYITSQGADQWRIPFRVYGKLMLNGVTIVPGRIIYTEFDNGKKEYRQICAESVRLEKNAVLVVNSSKLQSYGHWLVNGEPQSAIHKAASAKVYFNDGEIQAKSGSYCFSNSENVRVARGSFACSTVSPIVLGTLISYPKVGQVGLNSTNLALYTKADPSYITPNLAKVTVTAGTSQSYVYLKGESGTSGVDGPTGTPFFHLSESDPRVSVDFSRLDGDYFQGFDENDKDAPGLNHVTKYQWQVLSGNTVLSQLDYSADRTSVNVMTDFPGFTPVKGEKYKIRCTSRETLVGGVYFDRNYYDTFFEISKGSESNITDTVSINYTKPVAGKKRSELSYSCTDAQTTNMNWYRWVTTERGIETWEVMPSTASFTAGKKYMIRIQLKPYSGKTFATGTDMRVFLNSFREPLIIKELTASSMTIEKEYTIEEARINPFVDVFESDPYYDAVLWAYYAEPQITNGIDATHFGPKQTVTRGQAAAFLWRAMGCPEPTSTYNPFKDVPEWQYYYKPILWAVEKGITKGTSADRYSPDQTLTTAHIITFLYRTKNPGKDGWYQEAADWAGNGYGGLPFGVDIAVNDTTPCPRANVVMFLQKAK